MGQSQCVIKVNESKDNKCHLFIEKIGFLISVESVVQTNHLCTQIVEQKPLKTMCKPMIK